MRLEIEVIHSDRRLLGQSLDFYMRFGEQTSDRSLLLFHPLSNSGRSIIAYWGVKWYHYWYITVKRVNGFWTFPLFLEPRNKEGFWPHLCGCSRLDPPSVSLGYIFISEFASQ